MVGGREYENGSSSSSSSWPPLGIPLPLRDDEQQHWSSNFDSSVNAVSFGFVATAILIFMFLLMAIFERFLKPSSTTLRRNLRAADSPVTSRGKPAYPSPNMSLYTSWVSVMMPGDEIPTFIAHPAPAPAPAPCCPERISWPSHEHKTLSCSTSNINQV